MFRRNSSKNKHRRPLGRSKSTNSVARNPVNDLQSIEPLVAQRDAHIAARLSYYRAHGGYPLDMPAIPRQHGGGAHGLSRSDSAMSRTTTVQRDGVRRPPNVEDQGSAIRRQQSVRFTGSNARPRRALAARATDNSLPISRNNSTKTGSNCNGMNYEHNNMAVLRSETPIFRGPEQYYAVEDDKASIKSSYRKLRKSRSLFNSSGLAHSEYSFDKGSIDIPNPWSHGTSYYASLNKENGRRTAVKADETPGLKAPKPMSFLPSRREQQRTSASRMSSRDENDLAVQLAQEKFQQQMDQQKKLKHQPSLFFLSRNKRSEGSIGLRKSLRNSSNNSAAMSSTFSGDTVLIQRQNGLRKAARKVSSNLKSKIKGLFGRSKSEDIDCQKKDMSADSDGDSCIRHEDAIDLNDEASISQVHSHVPSLHAVPSSQQMRSRQGSMESANGEDKSRVTSWTNSTAETFAASSVVGDWDGQRLSVIKESNNTMHAPPALAQIGGAGQGPLSAAGKAIDSQRVYSALMKRLEDSKKKEEWQRERSVEAYKESGVAPPRGSSVDRVGSQDWSPPTIRCVRADDDVFQYESIKELDKPESKMAYHQNRSSPDMHEVPRFRLSDDDSHTSGKDDDMMKPPTNKSGGTKTTELRQPRTLSQRSSAFFASPTCHLFRTTSPFRKALRESMKASEDSHQSTQTMDLHYLKSLSSLSLPPRRPSTTGSNKESAIGTTAESIYSYDADETKALGRHKGSRCHLGEALPEVPKSSSRGNVTIFVNQVSSRTAETPVRDFSGASSVEWKTWLSSHVSRLEGSVTDRNHGESRGLLLPSLGHVRENAEIDSPGEAVEPSPSLSEVKPKRLSEATVENKAMHPSLEHILKQARKPSYPKDENSAPSLRKDIRKALDSPQPSPCYRSPETMQLGADRLSLRSIKMSDDASPKRSTHGVSPASSLGREELLRRRRARMGMATPKGVLSPAKSSPTLCMAGERQQGKSAAAECQKQTLVGRGQRSVPSLRGKASNGGNGLEQTHPFGPGTESQGMGSRKMVEMFLSSRRSKGEMRSGMRDAASSPVFL